MKTITKLCRDCGNPIESTDPRRVICESCRKKKLNEAACCVPYDSPPNEWVSVEERLPVEAKKVLCFLALGGGPMVETGYYMGDEGWYPGRVRPGR